MTTEHETFDYAIEAARYATHGKETMRTHAVRAWLDRIERAQARESAAQVGVPEGWLQFVQECAGTGGGEVCGNTLSRRAAALLSAAPAPAAEPAKCKCGAPKRSGVCTCCTQHVPAPQPAPSDAPASPQAAQGDVEAWENAISDEIGFEFLPGELQTVSGDELLRIARRIASLQPAAEFKVGDRVEYVLPPGGHRLLGTVVGFRVAIDETSAYIPCALPENLTRLTGGSHD